MYEAGRVYRWQLDMDKGLDIPFQRGVYAIGVRGLNINFEEEPYPKIIHLCTVPRNHGAQLWIGAISAGNCLKTIILDALNPVKMYFTDMEIEMFTIDLTFPAHLRIYCLNEQGQLVKVQGYCVLDAIQQ